MATKQYISYQKDGKPAYREATPEELASMQPEPLTWHYSECPIRITIPDEVRKEWLKKNQEDDILGIYPDISAILKYMKGLGKKRVILNGAIHIYLEEIYPEHRAVIEANGGLIENKPI